MTPAQRARRAVLRALPTRESQFIAASLREETVGGALLLVAALVALVWASSPFAESYADLRDTVLGPAALHLDLNLQEWAGDGLLAIFFFVAGLELKRELVVGQLAPVRRGRSPGRRSGVRDGRARAGLPGRGPAGPGSRAWLGGPDRHRHRVRASPCSPSSAPLCPRPLRAFLLTLAVVDDLGAILIIAVSYSDAIKLWSLAGRGSRARGLRLAAAARVRRRPVLLSRSRWWSGRSCTTSASTPPSPASHSGCSPGPTRRRRGRTRRRSASSTGAARSRPGSRCPCSPC